MDAPYYNGAPGPEHDPNAGGPEQPYICRECQWTGRAGKAAAHHYATGHAVRGRDWSASWPDAQFADNFQRQQKKQRTA